ncbi:MAG: methyltransferase domain-containing protein [Acidimicrobiia bacterium]|nr:methyltransferase domain-containing protein [Acidimicrobiia bacterium]
MTYTHGHDDSVLRSHRWRTAENSAAYLLPHLGAGMDLLDLGCGPGTITVDLARRTAPGKTVGLDSAAAVIDEARVAAGDAPVEFRVADLMHTGFPDNSFDVVHAHQVLQHLSDPVGALREMGRVCRRGGVVAVRDVDYEAMTWFPGDPMLTTWLDLYRRVHRANGSEPDAGRHLLDWARQAGFADITPSASVWCFANHEDRQWWGSLWADRMQRSGVADRALALGFASQKDLDEISDAWRAWSVEPSGWFAALHGEVLCRPAG